MNSIKNIAAYDAIKAALEDLSSLGEAASQISAIGAIGITDEWSTSQKKVLMLGQETGGLDHSLAEMRTDPLGIEKVAASFKWFDFAEGKEQRNSPFWRAHRRLVAELGESSYRQVMWSNLVKVQSALAQGSSILHIAPEYLQAVIDWQAPVIRQEIAEIAPKGLILFTGPRYDWILRRVFPGAELIPLEGSAYPVRTIARVVHPDLPTNTIRTYHPTFIQRSKQHSILDEVVAVLRST